MHLGILQALLLGIVEGITEFLPVSSTGHLTIVEKLLGLSVDDPGVTAFTAVIQVGAIAASIIYFRRDIARLAVAWFAGLRDRARRRHRLPARLAGDHRLRPDRTRRVRRPAPHHRRPAQSVGRRRGADHLERGDDHRRAVSARQDRTEADFTLRDTLTIGIMQCIALVPGVSRSGATISAGLFRGLDRVTATRISFFLAIPALLAAGGYEAATSAGAIATLGRLGRDRHGHPGQLRRRARRHRLAAAHRRPLPDHRLRRLPAGGRRGRGRPAARRHHPRAVSARRAAHPYRALIARS